MKNKLLKTLGLFSLCAMMMAATPVVVMADEKNPEYQTSTSMVVRVEADVTDVYTETDFSNCFNVEDRIGKSGKDVEHYERFYQTDRKHAGWN